MPQNQYSKILWWFNDEKRAPFNRWLIESHNAKKRDGTAKERKNGRMKTTKNLCEENREPNCRWSALLKTVADEWNNNNNKNGFNYKQYIGLWCRLFWCRQYISLYNVHAHTRYCRCSRTYSRSHSVALFCVLHTQFNRVFGINMVSASQLFFLFFLFFILFFFVIIVLIKIHNNVDLEEASHVNSFRLSSCTLLYLNLVIRAANSLSSHAL